MQEHLGLDSVAAALFRLRKSCVPFKKGGNMKRTCLVVMVLVLALVGIAIAQAPSSERDVYVVQQGDKLYTLEGDYSGRPWQWGRLVELNPFLKNPGRTWVDEKNRMIVLIKPGEKLNGLGELGIVPQPFPIGRLKIGAPPPAPTPAPADFDLRLLWLLAAAFILLGVALIIKRMRRDPVAAGIAVVPGGVVDTTAANQFRENLSRTTGTPSDRIEIRDLARGRIYGAVDVRYRDSSLRRMLLRGEVGYRAMVRRNASAWAEEFMLQGCGNDLRLSGVRYIPGFGFRFVPEAVVEGALRPAESPASASTVTSAPAQTQPQPATSDEGSEKHFTFRPAGGGRPNFVDSKGYGSFEVEVKDGRTMVRFS